MTTGAVASSMFETALDARHLYLSAWTGTQPSDLVALSLSSVRSYELASSFVRSHHSVSMLRTGSSRSQLMTLIDAIISICRWCIVSSDPRCCDGNKRVRNQQDAEEDATLISMLMLSVSWVPNSHDEDVNATIGLIYEMLWTWCRCRGSSFKDVASARARLRCEMDEVGHVIGEPYCAGVA